VFPDAPRADRKGGEGVSTALHNLPLSPPAVARREAPLRETYVRCCAVLSTVGIADAHWSRRWLAYLYEGLTAREKIDRIA
jgi:hypothetical protein